MKSERNWGRLGMKSNWMTTTINDVCSLVTDGAHNSPKSVEKGRYMASVKDFTEFGFDFSNCRRISEEDYERLRKQGCVPEKDDILVGKDGARYFEDIVIYKQDEQPALLSSIAILRADRKKIIPEFLYYTLKTPAVKKNVRDNYGSGSAIQRIVLKDFKRMPFSFPSVDEQRKITAICSAIDSKIQVNNAINKNLLEQARTLFISWFVDYTPFNGTKPDLWKNKSVYELAEYINGAAFKKNEYADKGLPIIKITELKNGITNATQYCCTEKDVKYYIDDRDILFSWSGNPDTSIDTFLWSNGKAILNQHTFRVVSKYNAPAFTFFLLKYLKPQYTHIASNKQTTGLGHVTVADLKRLQFCADENAIRDFNAITMPFFDMIFSNYKENQYLSSLRDTILPQLMSGKLDVSEIDL